ncbi:polyprenyl synthetase family protein [Aeropyrum pernix]|nr:polyprenyl synthetase family protein [Aeropyrum pernix]
MKWDRLFEASSRYSMLIDHYIMDFMSITPDRLSGASLHLIKAGGKRLRPLITLLTARMLGGLEAEARAVPLAASIETAHTFSLIHDDIMDRDEVRRGVPTTHVVYGDDWAILAGDTLHAAAFKMIADSREWGMSPEQAYRAFKVLSEAAIQISRGQAYDMLFEETWDVDVADYLNMVRLKTGALIEAAARIGAVAAGAGSEIEKMVGEVGMNAGIAFQIRDDILGVIGDPKVTGKPVYNDLRRGKKTLLVIYAVKKAGRREVVDLIGPKASEDDLKRAASIIVDSGALDYAESKARFYVGRARDILSRVPAVDAESKELLNLLLDYIVEREK